MSFGGWPAEALEFYEGLEADNSRAYWTAHKAAYEEKVLGPMTELVEELSADFGEPKIFRPYRDVRFSKDKSPYKTAIAAALTDGYIQLSASGLAAGSGMYAMDSGQLARYRLAVASDETGAELAGVIAGIEQQQIAVRGHGMLKTAPRGYAADHPRIGLLRYKGVITWKEWPVEPWLGTSAAKDRVATFLEASRPLGIWLSANVGSQAAEPARR